MQKEDETFVVIPCYNEENNLPKVLDELRDVKRHLSNLHFLFVNDSSSDGTERILHENAEECINHPVNLGYSSAIQTGIKCGLNRGYKRFIILDGDGQHPPKEMEKLMDAYGDDVDILIGSRFNNGFNSTYEIPVLRKLGMIFFSFLTSLLIGSRIKDTTSGYQIFNDKVARSLLLIYEAEYPDAEVIFLLKLLKFKIKEIPIEMRSRESGKSMISSFSSLYYPVRVLAGLFFAIGRYFVIRRKIENA